MIPSAPTGPARIIYIIGLLAVLAGVAIVVFTVVTRGLNMASIGRALPVAVGLATLGIIVATLASALGPQSRQDAGPRRSTGARQRMRAEVRRGKGGGNSDQIMQQREYQQRQLDESILGSLPEAWADQSSRRHDEVQSWKMERWSDYTSPPGDEDVDPGDPGDRRRR
jgi:hypothetical protein